MWISHIRHVYLHVGSHRKDVNVFYLFAIEGGIIAQVLWISLIYSLLRISHDPSSWYCDTERMQKGMAFRSLMFTDVQRCVCASFRRYIWTVLTWNCHCSVWPKWFIIKSVHKGEYRPRRTVLANDISEQCLWTLLTMFRRDVEFWRTFT